MQNALAMYKLLKKPTYYSRTILNKSRFFCRPGSSSYPGPGGAGFSNSRCYSSGGVRLLSSHVQMQEKQQQ